MNNTDTSVKFALWFNIRFPVKEDVKHCKELGYLIHPSAHFIYHVQRYFNGFTTAVELADMITSFCVMLKIDKIFGRTCLLRFINALKEKNSLELFDGIDLHVLSDVEDTDKPSQMAVWFDTEPPTDVQIQKARNLDMELYRDMGKIAPIVKDHRDGVANDRETLVRMFDMLQPLGKPVNHILLGVFDYEFLKRMISDEFLWDISDHHSVKNEEVIGRIPWWELRPTFWVWEDRMNVWVDYNTESVLAFVETILEDLRKQKQEMLERLRQKPQ
jgi:hypothetical protein